MSNKKQRVSKKTITQVGNVNKVITSQIVNLEKQGIKFEGTKTIKIDTTNMDGIKEKLTELETQLKDAVYTKSTTDKNLQARIIIFIIKRCTITRL